MIILGSKLVTFSVKSFYNFSLILYLFSVYYERENEFSYRYYVEQNGLKTVELVRKMSEYYYFTFSQKCVILLVLKVFFRAEFVS